uniref:Uncharacterized protein n=1 Tax=Arundo donax TaxID=35708 RepID=A0A0A9FI75_ARUDO
MSLLVIRSQEHVGSKIIFLISMPRWQQTREE